MDRLMLLLISALAACATPAHAYQVFAERKPATIDCVIEAAKRQGVAPNTLLAIASIERGKNGQTVRNQNGSLDMGHFQINTIHWQPGGKFHGIPEITKDVVTHAGCYNAELAAWLLRRALDAPNPGGRDYWSRAADYHSATPVYNQVYRAKLITLATRWGDWLKYRYPEKVAVSYQRVANNTIQ